jgi:hypothetical protein
MGSFLERPQSWVRKYENDGSATLAQGHLVLDPVVYKHGRIIDTNGIVAGGIGLYESYPGMVIQADSDEISGFSNAQVKDPVYQEPGHGPVLAAPTATSWIVGEIWEDQGSNTFIKYQSTIPVLYEGT